MKQELLDAILSAFVGTPFEAKQSQVKSAVATKANPAVFLIEFEDGEQTSLHLPEFAAENIDENNDLVKAIYTALFGGPFEGKEINRVTIEFLDGQILTDSKGS